MRRNYIGGLLAVPLLVLLPFVLLFRCGQWLWHRLTPMKGTILDLRKTPRK